MPPLPTKLAGAGAGARADAVGRCGVARAVAAGRDWAINPGSEYSEGGPEEAIARIAGASDGRQ